MGQTNDFERRSKYVALRRQDRWIVPLLADAIDSAIYRHGASAVGGRSCLDVGCGNQPLRAQLEAAGFRYTSLDVQQNTLGNVDFIAPIDGQLPPLLCEQAFDFIVCTEVLEHVPRWPQAFGNFAALLRPGGKLLITSPHIWVPHEEPHDFYRPTTWAIKFHAEATGLKVVELVRAGDGYDVLGTVLAAVRCKPTRLWLWPAALPVVLLRKLMLAILSRRFIRNIVALRTGLYLSVVAVLEKPK